MVNEKDLQCISSSIHFSRNRPSPSSRSSRQSPRVHARGWRQEDGNPLSPYPPHRPSQCPTCYARDSAHSPHAWQKRHTNASGLSLVSVLRYRMPGTTPGGRGNRVFKPYPLRTFSRSLSSHPAVTILFLIPTPSSSNVEQTQGCAAVRSERAAACPRRMRLCSSEYHITRSLFLLFSIPQSPRTAIAADNSSIFSSSARAVISSLLPATTT
jgi:hypothetical protein